MQEVIATITSRGRITLPPEIRRHLDVSVHDEIAFRLDDAGTVTVRAVRLSAIAPWRGAAGSLPHAMPWEQVLRIAREDRGHDVRP